MPPRGSSGFVYRESLFAPTLRTDSFVFRYLQIPCRTNPFFSHPYKTPGVSSHLDSKAFSVLSVSSVLSVLNSFLHPFSISL